MILGIDWLSTIYTVIDYKKRSVVIKIVDQLKSRTADRVRACFTMRVLSHLDAIPVEILVV